MTRSSGVSQSKKKFLDIFSLSLLYTVLKYYYAFDHRQRGMSEKLDTKTLFVRQVPTDATNEEFSEFFSQFAPIKHAVIVYDQDKNSRGFGFVSFALDEDATEALQKSRKTRFKGSLLRVDIAKRRERTKNAKLVAKEREDPDSIEAPNAESIFKKEVEEKRRARLIIRNLPWSIKNPEELKKVFQRYGGVGDCIIPKKKDGKMCGFGFVQMKRYKSAVLAVEKSKDLKIAGRKVAVDFALEKSKWEEIRETVAPTKEEDEDEEEEEDEDDEDEEDDGDEDDEDDEDANDEDTTELEKVNFEDKAERPKQNRQEPYTVFLRNLPYDVNKEGLTKHFEQFGPVKYALPVIDKETNMARGTGFVAFESAEGYDKCLQNAPEVNKGSSTLLSDDVPAAYVYDGRILSITPAVNREKASVLKDKNAEQRALLLGKDITKGKDKRNIFLLNEGRVTNTSKLAQLISKSELEIREKSYQLRIDQLNKNPSLHISLTRLAIRNLPRSMTEKSFKALGRKAVVEFAKQVKEEVRQPLSKEEVIRSTKHKHENSMEEAESKKSKKKGVVRQAKILVEVSNTGQAGRSKGYGFLEYRDHKSALMALRYLNCHEVTHEEIIEGLTDEEKKAIKFDGSKRRLIAEFAIEHAKVVQRRKEKVKTARDLAELKKEQSQEKGEGAEEDEQTGKNGKTDKKGKNDKKDKKGKKDKKDKKDKKGKNSKNEKNEKNGKKDKHDQKQERAGKRKAEDGGKRKRQKTQ